jgi:hypothetical protein
MMNKIVKTLCFILISFKCYCQYDFVIDALSIKRSKIKMNELEGTFENISSSGFNDTRRYKFDNQKIDLTFIENNYSGECDSFKLFGKKVGIQGKFGRIMNVCSLDVTSFQVFKFTFNNRKYILIESIENASGTSTSYIIFHLFDVTHKNNILYFPAWSVYGSKSCFADFDNDGKLDFLTIRAVKTGVDDGIYNATLSSIDYRDKKFKPTDDDKYILFRRTYNSKNNMVIKVLKKHW